MQFLDFLQIFLDSSLLVAIVGGIFKYLEWSNKKKKPYTKALGVRQEVGYLTKIFQAENDLQRVLVLKGENGGRPRADSSFYSSVIHEATRDGLPNIKERWQRQEIDTAYEKVLHEMCSVGSIILVTRELDDGHLKDSYIRSKTEVSLLEIVNETRDRMIYISVHIDTRDLMNNPVFRDDLRIYVERLKKIYSQKK